MLGKGILVWPFSLKDASNAQMESEWFIVGQEVNRSIPEIMFLEDIIH